MKIMYKKVKTIIWSNVENYPWHKIEAIEDLSFCTVGDCVLAPVLRSSWRYVYFDHNDFNFGYSKYGIEV